MTVTVKKGDVIFDCHSEEQLASFLEDGYIKVNNEPVPTAEESEKPKAKKPTSKK